MSPAALGAVASGTGALLAELAELEHSRRSRAESHLRRALELLDEHPPGVALAVSLAAAAEELSSTRLAPRAELLAALAARLVEHPR